MLICFDIGNTSIATGVYLSDKLLFKFLYIHQKKFDTQGFANLLSKQLHQNNIETHSIESICVGSVVPNLTDALEKFCYQFFKITPFIVSHKNNLSVEILIDNPSALGADFIASSVAATEYFKHQHKAIVNFGTATTVSFLNNKDQFIGGTIMPGAKIAIESLGHATALLPSLSPKIPQNIIGKNTKDAIFSGIYYSQIGGVKQVIEGLKDTLDPEDIKIIFTGGYAYLFKDQDFFDIFDENLVLNGLQRIFYMKLM